MNWKEQLSNSITTTDQLAEKFGIDPEPLRAVVDRYPLGITPHYAKLIEYPGDPIWNQCVPQLFELDLDDLPEDSMNESAFSPLPAIVHRYPDRALLMVSGRCAGYCRFCTRKSRVGKREFCFNKHQIEEGLAYIADTPEIRDVILTGGDPLLLDDDVIENILNRLHHIRHVEIVRIGSRVPVTLPARITQDLCTKLSKYQPLYLNTHFNHPRELTKDSVLACGRLADVGISLGNQSVLLKGVNDDWETMLSLCRGLLKARVRPYYLHHLDQAKGTTHFRVPVERGLSLLQAMHGQISGMGIPQYIVDPPGGQGKVRLNTETLVHSGETMAVRTSSGVVELPNQIVGAVD